MRDVWVAPPPPHPVAPGAHTPGGLSPPRPDPHVSPQGAHTHTHTGLPPRVVSTTLESHEGTPSVPAPPLPFPTRPGPPHRVPPEDGVDDAQELLLEARQLLPHRRRLPLRPPPRGLQRPGQAPADVGMREESIQLERSSRVGRISAIERHCMTRRVEGKGREGVDGLAEGEWRRSNASTELEGSSEGIVLGDKCCKTTSWLLLAVTAGQRLPLWPGGSV